MKKIPQPLPEFVYRVDWSKTSAWRPGDPVDFVTQYKVRAYDLADPSCKLPSLELLNITAYHAASRSGNGMAYARDFICRTSFEDGYFVTAKKAIDAFIKDVEKGVTAMRRQIAKINADIEKSDALLSALKE